MCPCDLSQEYVCSGCTAVIEDIHAALIVAERRGDDDQRELRGKLARLGLKADIVLHRKKIRDWERENAA